MCPLAATLFGFVIASFAGSPDVVANESTIRALLTTPKSWTMYLDFTDALAPSDRAQKFVWRYFEKDGKVWGRRIPPLAVGDCLSEITIRADGFSFRWCDPQLSAQPSLTYDPGDSKYRFKNQEPRKLWLQSND
jgi:hypothetical protein